MIIPRADILSSSTTSSLLLDLTFFHFKAQADALGRSGTDHFLCVPLFNWSTMHDPFPIPPSAWLTELVTPVAEFLKLYTLPLHIHEILIAALSYQFICSVLSPLLSTICFPQIYCSLPRRTRLNWDVHFVSMVQSITINSLALWVMWVDKERGRMTWDERIWGYDGAGGMIQGFAAGYFLWDLIVCVRWVDLFGWGMLAHAISALVVFSVGFVSGLLPFFLPVFQSTFHYRLPRDLRVLLFGPYLKNPDVEF